MVQQILVAGNETSTNAIAGGVVLLIQNPEEQAKLRANPALIPGARRGNPAAGDPDGWYVAERDRGHSRWEGSTFPKVHS